MFLWSAFFKGRMLQPLSVVVLLELVEIIFDPIGLHHATRRYIFLATDIICSLSTLNRYVISRTIVQSPLLIGSVFFRKSRLPTRKQEILSVIVSYKQCQYEWRVKFSWVGRGWVNFPIHLREETWVRSRPGSGVIEWEAKDGVQFHVAKFVTV